MKEVRRSMSEKKSALQARILKAARGFREAPVIW
jgi:hypothetical protein